MGIFGKKAVHHRLSYKWDRDTLGKGALKHSFLFQRRLQKSRAQLGDVAKQEKNLDSSLHSSTVLPETPTFLFKAIIIEY